MVSEPYVRSHTPTWTPPSEWLAYEDSGQQTPQPDREFDRPRHRRAQTALTRPPTTNVLAAADKTHLRKSTRKLERVLGEVPVLEHEDQPEPWQAHDAGAALRRRGTHDASSARVTQRAGPFVLTCSYLRSLVSGFSMDMPSRSTSPYPQLRIVPSTDEPLPSVVSASPGPYSMLTPDGDDRSRRLSSSSGTSDITPPATPDHDDKKRKQHQMAKLQRYLGESVPAELLLQPTPTSHSTSHSATSSISSVHTTSTDMSFGAASVAEAGTPPQSLKTKAKRRLSLELSALASFSLTSRLASAGPPPPRPATGIVHNKSVPAVLAIHSSSSGSLSPTSPTSIGPGNLSRVGTDSSVSAATRRSIEKELQLRPKRPKTATIREEAEEMDPMALIYGSQLPMPKIQKKAKDKEQKVKTKTSSISGGFWGGRSSTDKKVRGAGTRVSKLT